MIGVHDETATRINDGGVNLHHEIGVVLELSIAIIDDGTRAVLTSAGWGIAFYSGCDLDHKAVCWFTGLRLFLVLFTRA